LYLNDHKATIIHGSLVAFN